MRRACACLAPRQLLRRPDTPRAACLSTAVPAAAPRDLRSPADLYPGARAIRRVVHIHCGPTNSGKTHFALRALAAASSGVYCGPLRLLAWEVHERLNAQGVACNLATGQELLEVPGAEHTACTVEMVQLERRMDVVVMDEVQMIANADRGWAWSRVLLGVQAQEVHVCGSLDAVPLVRQLAALCGDEVREHSYERLTPLRVMDSGASFPTIGRGDCVVAFSRRQLYTLKAAIEAATPHKCSIIYGSLPPETRREQASLFNSAGDAQGGGDGCNVLVASDAIGMGLNLNLRRVIFASLDKFDGEALRPLLPAEVQQIAGRAGRFQTEYGEGLVTCLDARDLEALRECMAAEPPPLESAGLSPTFEQLQRFCLASRRKMSFANLLQKFEEGAKVDGCFFCCSLEAAQKVAEVIEDAPLSLRQRYLLCQAPFDVPDDSVHTAALQDWAWALAQGYEVTLPFAPPNRLPKTHLELSKLESYHRLLDAYLWLSIKFPSSFADPEQAVEFQVKSSQYISDAVLSLPPPEKKKQRPTARTPAAIKSRLSQRLQHGRSASRPKRKDRGWRT
jgi:ATP-dependent RNA helicase SUPV3L1/SUV3